MAGTYSPRNVGKLLIAADGTTRAGDTITDYLGAAVAANLEAAAINADGTALSADSPFKVYVKETDTSYGINFSDTIDPAKVKNVSVAAYTAPVERSIRATGFTGTVEDAATYRVSIRKFDHIQSPVNFRHIHGFYVSPADASGVAWATVIQEIAENLEAALLRENSIAEFTITQNADSIDVTAVAQPLQLGKKQGLPINFELEVSVKKNSPTDLNGASDLGLLGTTVLQAGNQGGVGTGKQVADLEYFLKGYDNADYGREVGFPNNFDPTLIANINGIYNTVRIEFFSQRDYNNVENQLKELTVVFDKGTDVPANNAETNGFLAQLRTVLGAGNVPSDLPVV